MIIQPWKIVETRYVEPGVRVDRCELPNGHVLDCHLLEYADEIVVFAVTNKQEVVLIRQYRHGARETIVELPGGSVDAGEIPIEAAKRELMEETGYASATWIEVGSGSPNPAIYTNKIYSFLALDAERIRAQSVHDREFVEVFLTQLADVVEMAKRGEFVHSLNISTLFFVLAYLHRVS